MRQQKGPLQTAGTQGLNTESRAWNSSLTPESGGWKCGVALLSTQLAAMGGIGRGKSTPPGETQGGVGDVLTHSCGHRGREREMAAGHADGRDPGTHPSSTAHPQTPASMGPARALAHTQRLGPRLGSSDPVSPGWGLSICFQPGQLLALLPWVTGRARRRPQTGESSEKPWEQRASRWGRAWNSLPSCCLLGQLVSIPQRAHSSPAASQEGLALSALRGPGRGRLTSLSLEDSLPREPGSSGAWTPRALGWTAGETPPEEHAQTDGAGA